MSAEKKEYIAKRLEKAEHDLSAAKTIIEYNPLVLDVACFHCQQTAEKYLKAFLVFHNKEIAKTHSIDYLLSLCILIDKDFENINPKNIEDFAVDARYPDNFMMPDAQEAKEYLAIAEEIKALVVSKL